MYNTYLKFTFGCHFSSDLLEEQGIRIVWRHQWMINKPTKPLRHILVSSQNYEKRLLAWSCLSGCLSVCPHGTTQLLLEGFSWMSIIVQQDATVYSLLYFCKPLYMFRVVTPPIIRSTYNCNYTIWHCSRWWVELPPETRRADYRNIINCI
jgi:hypothetical protein